jgi:putative nucleotide binding protein
LDFIPNGRSTVIRGREGPIVQAIGEENLVILEILSTNNVTFDSGERIYIGKEGRKKIISVLGRLNYGDLSANAKNEIPYVCEKIVLANEQRFVKYFNESMPVTPRLHSLELIPGIGKTYMMQIINEREKRPFVSFEDINKRSGLRDVVKLITRRIIEELQGNTRIFLFVKK